MTNSPLKTHIIYAREDFDALVQLKKSLKLLENYGQIKIWYDGEIIIGQEPEKAIKLHLESADIILLLLSKDFLFEDVVEKELHEALARHEKGKSMVIPIILRPCLWELHPEIRKFKVLPENKKPIFSKHWFDSDEAFYEVSMGIYKTVRAARIKKIEEVIEPWTKAINALSMASKITQSDTNGVILKMESELKKLKQEVENEF